MSNIVTTKSKEFFLQNLCSEDNYLSLSKKIYKRIIHVHVVHVYPSILSFGINAQGISLITLIAEYTNYMYSVHVVVLLFKVVHPSMYIVTTF